MRNKEQTMTRHNSAVLTSTTIYVLSKNMKNMRVFLSENFLFLEVKFSIYLDRRVFVIRNKEQTMTRHNSAVAITHMRNKELEQKNVLERQKKLQGG